MADRDSGKTTYNWKYSGDDAGQYREKYTHAFDPDYLKHIVEDLEQEEEEARREEPKRRRPASQRQKRLSAQQEVVSARRRPSGEKRRSGQPRDSAERQNAPRRRSAQKQQRGRRGRGGSYRRQLRRIRMTYAAIGAGLLVFLILLLVNHYTLRIEIEGGDPYYMEIGEEFKEPGVAAYYTGSIFHRQDTEVAVVSTNTIDNTRCGTYEVTYHAEHRKKEAELTRMVIIPDRQAPDIQLDPAVNVVRDNTLWEDSYKAVDDQDGDITDRVEVTGEVNMQRTGRYELTYTVSDEAGNTATATRWVTVSDVPINDPSKAKQGDENVIYLTFDDGPGMYTDELLDLLDRYNVKATFFVTDTNPNLRDLIKEEYDRGHTIGVHTASHDYDLIYQDPETYWDDFDQEMAIVEEQIGFKPKYMRFPGGSSNSYFSENGEMAASIMAELKNRGLRYYDWSIDSYDSDDEMTEDDIFWSLANQVSVIDTKMVLCHDLKKVTVDVMDDFLSWAIEYGYVFLPINEESPQVHH